LHKVTLISCSTLAMNAALIDAAGGGGLVGVTILRLRSYDAWACVLGYWAERRQPVVLLAQV
jgi:hypothetical protein